MKKIATVLFTVLAIFIFAVKFNTTDEKIKIVITPTKSAELVQKALKSFERKMGDKYEITVAADYSAVDNMLKNKTVDFAYSTGYTKKGQEVVATATRPQIAGDKTFTAKDLNQVLKEEKKAGFTFNKREESDFYRYGIITRKGFKLPKDFKDLKIAMPDVHSASYSKLEAFLKAKYKNLKDLTQIKSYTKARGLDTLKDINGGVADVSIIVPTMLSQPEAKALTDVNKLDIIALTEAIPNDSFKTFKGQGKVVEEQFLKDIKKSNTDLEKLFFIKGWK